MNWEKKIIALLHDPLFKAMDIKGHEGIAREILDAVGISSEKVKEEDWIASAMDRLPIPWKRAIKSESRWKRPVALHTLSRVTNSMF